MVFSRKDVSRMVIFPDETFPVCYVWWLDAKVYLSRPYMLCRWKFLQMNGKLVTLVRDKSDKRHILDVNFSIKFNPFCASWYSRSTRIYGTWMRRAGADSTASQWRENIIEQWSASTHVAQYTGVSSIISSLERGLFCFVGSHLNIIVRSFGN